MPFDIEGARKAGYTDDQILEYVRKAANIKFDADAALKSGYSKREVAEHLAQYVDDTLGERPAEPPNLVSPQDATKRAALETTGEILGGMGGALAGGGWLSVPGAGAGAVAGKETGGFVADALGIPRPDTTPMEQLKDAGKTFAYNAMGEGLFRSIPAGLRLAKTVAKNTGKKIILNRIGEATPEAKTLATLSGKYGIPLNLGQQSGKPWVQNLEVAFDRSPFSTGIVRDFRAKQYGMWQQKMNGLLDRLHGGEISQEEFSRLADDSFRQLRGQFNARMEKGAAAVGKLLNPEAVPDVVAGTALQEGRKANLKAVGDWADKAYAPFRTNTSMVDLSPLGEEAEALSNRLPQGGLRDYFSGKARRWIGSAQDLPQQAVDPDFIQFRDDISASLAGDKYTKLSPADRQKVDALLAKMGKGGEAGPPEVSLGEAISTRSRLLRMARSLPKDANPDDVWTIHSLVDGIDASIEKSLGATKDGQALLDQLRKTNTQYRGFMEKLKPPTVRGKTGNPTARILQNAEVPEKIPGQVANSPTLVKGAEAASSPETTASINAAAASSENPIHQLRRNVFDNAVEGARVEDPTTGASRISPTKLKQTLPPTVPELYGERAASVVGLTQPDLAARENLLFRSPFAKSVDRGSNTGQIMNAAFPQRNPEEVRTTLGLMDEAGVAPQTRRAFGQHLYDRSTTWDKTVGDTRVLNPRTLERQVEAYGDTVPEALGPGVTRKMGELNTVGKGITSAESIFGNPSGTSRAMEVLGIAGNLMRPSKWPGLATRAWATVGGAKAFVDPSILRTQEALLPSLTPQSTPAKVADALFGTAGRIPGVYLDDKERRRRLGLYEPDDTVPPPTLD